MRTCNNTLKAIGNCCLTFAALLVVMGNTAPTCTPIEPEMEVLCGADSECANLNAPVKCPGQFTCNEGACEYICDEDVEPEPPESECIDDSDCGSGQYCEIVDCWAPPCLGEICALSCMAIGECMDNEPEGCLDDSDCPVGFVCEPLLWMMEKDGTGNFDSPPNQGQCIPDTEPELCSSSEECGGGEICSVELGDCLPAPGCDEVGMGCLSVCFGECVQKPQDECYSDDDCGPGFMCELVEDCILLPCDCYEGEDCGAPEECASYAICVPIQQGECFEDSDCGPGFVCELMDSCYDGCDGDEDYCGPSDCAPYGICVKDPEPQNPCVVTGCSGQLCASHDIATTCEWLPIYACFQEAECGLHGVNGTCAWKHTSELTDCLAGTDAP